MKPFNLEEALAGKPVVTRDGRKVTAIYHFTESKSNFSVIAHIEKSYGVDTFTVNGKWEDGIGLNERDLFMDTTYKYFNVYYKGTDAWCGTFCDTPEQAKERADQVTNGLFLTTLKVEI
jgi:hypothetical protein